MSPLHTSELSGSALQYREEIAGTASGFRALAKNYRTLAVTCFACIGGLLYGYNQGVFSGILTMSSFGTASSKSKVRRRTKSSAFILSCDFNIAAFNRRWGKNLLNE